MAEVDFCVHHNTVSFTIFLQILPWRCTLLLSHIYHNYQGFYYSTLDCFTTQTGACTLCYFTASGILFCVLQFLYHTDAFHSSHYTLSASQLTRPILICAPYKNFTFKEFAGPNCLTCVQEIWHIYHHLLTYSKFFLGSTLCKKQEVGHFELF